MNSTIQISSGYKDLQNLLRDFIAEILIKKEFYLFQSTITFLQSNQQTKITIKNLKIFFKLEIKP